MPSVLGLPYVLNEFYYRGQLVGKTLQYEQEVLSDLWKYTDVNTKTAG